MAAEAKPTPEQDLATRRRRRSVALGLVLAGLALLFYALTIAKMWNHGG